jgi:hypothetical protein
MEVLVKSGSKIYVQYVILQNIYDLTFYKRSVEFQIKGKGLLIC